MVDIKKFLTEARIDRSRPLSLAYISHVLEGIDDEALLEYAQTAGVDDPKTLERLIVANALLKELKERDPERVSGIITSLKRDRPLKDIVEQTALELSGAIPAERYEEIEDQAKADITNEIRRSQYETIRRRIKPFYPYTSKQLYARLAVATAAIFLAFSFSTLSRYRNDAALLELAKEHQLRVAETMRASEVGEILESRTPARQFVPTSIDGTIEDKETLNYLNAINSMSIIDNTGNPSRELLEVKLSLFDKFISGDSEVPLSILINYDKGIALEDGKVVLDYRQQGLNTIELALTQGADYTNLFDAHHLLEFAKRAYYWHFDASKNHETAYRNHIMNLSRFGQEIAGTRMGDMALSLVASLLAGEEEFYSPSNGYIEIGPEYKNMGMAAALKDVEKDPEKAKELYTLITETTNEPNCYGAAAYALVMMDAQDTMREGSLSERQEFADRLLTIAGAVSDVTIRDRALFKAAQTYISMKRYEQGNELLKFVADETEDDDLRSKAVGAQVNVGWAEFWDNVRR